MMTPPKSKGLTQKPPKAVRMLPSRRNATHYERDRLMTDYGNLTSYVLLKNLYGVEFPPSLLALWRSYGSRECLYITCEGTLFGTEHKQQLRQTGKSFSWKTYYESILHERINVQYIPLLKAAKELDYALFLVCSTPTEYADPVKQKLLTHRLHPPFFTKVVFKPRPTLSTESWFKSYFEYVRAGRFKRRWIISDTFQTRPDDDLAFYF